MGGSAGTSTAGDEYDKTPTQEQKCATKKYCDVRIEKCYKGQNLLSLLLSLHIWKSRAMLKRSVCIL